MMKSALGAWLVAHVLGASLSMAQSPAGGETRVARWKDDATAAFLLMYDDSWPSHFQVAVPELVKRGMVGTFYINPGKGEYKKFAAEWEEKLWKQGMVYGNHTMTHKGVKDMENAEWEIGECARIIRSFGEGKADRLVSYGQPGVPKGTWNITPEQLDELLKKHHLISRPTFDGHGAVYHLKTSAEVLALADKAIQAKGMEYLVIHGLERMAPNWGYQDFWPFPQKVYTEILDGLKERRDKGQLWITDHISQHQYETEREGASVKVLEAGEKGIKLELKTTADAKYYDQPLTLVTQVPAAWRKATATQGGKSATVPVKDGKAVFDAVPDGSVITLAPGNE